MSTHRLTGCEHRVVGVQLLEHLLEHDVLVAARDLAEPADVAGDERLRLGDLRRGQVDGGGRGATARRPRRLPPSPRARRQR